MKPEWNNPEFLRQTVCKEPLTVRDGIPRYIESHYADTFGFEWQKFAETMYDSDALPNDFKKPEFITSNDWTEEFDDEWRKLPFLSNFDQKINFETAATFAAKTGFAPEELKDKLVLDVGCGSGRFLDILAKSEVKVVGIDPTSAIDSAGEILAKRGLNEKVGLVQCGIEDMPFHEETFDFIFSIGVLHHTPSIFESLRKLVKFLKPGGTLAIWIYHPVGSRRTLNRFWWRIIHNFSEKTILNFVKPFVELYPIYKLRPWGYFLKFLFPICMHPDYEMRLCGTFDSYSPRYVHLTLYPDAISYFRKLGFENIEIGPFPTSIRGRKPERREE